MRRRKRAVGARRLWIFVERSAGTLREDGVDVKALRAAGLRGLIAVRIGCPMVWEAITWFDDRWLAAFHLRLIAVPLEPVGGNHGYPYTTGRYGFATQGLSPTSYPLGDDVRGLTPLRKSSTTSINVSWPGMNSLPGGRGQTSLPNCRVADGY